MGRQVVSLPFTAGLDSKTDAYLAMRPSRVENRLVRGGTLQRRFGTTQIPNALDTGGSVTASEAVEAFGAELLRFGGGGLYGYSSSAREWVTKSTGNTTAKLAVTPIVYNSTQPVSWDFNTIGNVSCFAWTDNVTFDLRIALRDDVTGNFYLNGDTAVYGDLGLSKTPVWPRVLAFGNIFLVLFGDSFAAPSATSILCVTVTANPRTATPSTIVSGVTTLQTDMYGAGGAEIFDALAVSGTAAMVVYATSATVLKAFTVTAATKTIAVAATTVLTLTAGPLRSLAMAQTTDTNVFIAASESTTPRLYFAVFTPVIVSVLSNTTISTTNVKYLGMVESATNVVTLTATSPTGLTLGSAALTKTGVSTALAFVTINAQCAAKPFLYQGSVCVPVVAGSAGGVEATGLVVTVAGVAIARFAMGLASATVWSDGRCPNTITPDSSRAWFLFGTSTGTTNIGGGAAVPTPLTLIGRVELTLASVRDLPLVAVGRDLHVGGALPRIYDGNHYVEEGWTLFLENATAIGASTGGLSAGVYEMCAVLSWTDSFGQIHRSAPSIPIAWTAGASSNKTFNINIPQWTAKPVFQMEVYRTTANGTVFYREYLIDLTLGELVGQTIIQIVCATTDAIIQAYELLYTTGGVEDNIAPPSYSIACEHKTRLIIAGLENPYQWRSSSVTIQSEGLRFNEDWGGFVPAATGRITALASMDGNLIIFTEQAAYLIQGDGPDLLGNNNWLDPQLVTSLDGGPLSPHVLSASDGIFFQNARGWQQLTRGLQVQYIGADVEEYSDFVCRSATLRPEFEECWFQVDNGNDLAGQQTGQLVPSGGGLCLVYNTHYGQWSVLTNYGAQSACYFQGAYTRARSDGVVFQEVPGTYADSGAFFSTTVETSWMKPAQLVQGYQRIWRASLLGLYASDATVKWEAAYDYNPSYLTADSVSVPGQGVYAPGGPFQVRRHMRLQKCEALKFRITDTPVSGSGQGVGLTSLDLEFGGYGRLFLLPASQSK